MLLTWTARRSNQSIPKEISLEYSLEGLMLKLKFQSLSTWFEELTPWKIPWGWERSKAGEEGNRGWDVGWHHRLNGYEFEQAPGDSEGQGSLSCYSPQGHKESNRTQQQQQQQISAPWMAALWPRPPAVSRTGSREEPSSTLGLPGCLLSTEGNRGWTPLFFFKLQWPASNYSYSFPWGIFHNPQVSMEPKAVLTGY